MIKLNKYFNVEDLCDICRVVYIMKGNIILSQYCKICRKKYNRNKSLAFADKKGGKDYWNKERMKPKNIKNREKYYKKNKVKILAYQKEIRDNKNLKQEQL